MKRHDQPLHNYLKTLGIEPQLYALRWVRLLFGREFHFEDVITIWDALLAYDVELTLVDYISVTMLMFIRESILGKEYVEAMARLMKFPPVEDVAVFIESALKMVKKHRHEFISHPIATKTAPLVDSKTLVYNIKAKPTTSTNSSAKADEFSNDKDKDSFKAKYQQLIEANAIISRRLNHIIGILQTQMLSDTSNIPDMDSALVSIAELKQMKVFVI